MTALPAPTPDRPDGEIDVKALRTGWENLKDTHDFFILLKKLGVGRVQALRLIGKDLAWAVRPDTFAHLLEHASATGLSIMIFVGSPGVIQIHTGPVKAVKPMGPWINVMDPEFNLHVRQDLIASAWIVRKPTVDGVVTSLELYDAAGGTVLQMFGERKPGKPELQTWRDAVNRI